MSPFIGGLLAGGAQALTTIGSAMFSDSIDQRKQERLQVIRDKEYDRARQDQLADYQRARTDQLADVDSQREFQRGLLTDERGYLDSVRETEAGYVVSTQIDDEGNLKGITRGGTMVDLGQLATVDPLLQSSLESLKLAQADAARIDLERREDNPVVWDALDVARNQFNRALEDSRVRLGREPQNTQLDIGQFGGEAPPEALEILRQNPTLEIKMQFLSRYGYLPAL
jgi:hypothetical protein